MTRTAEPWVAGPSSYPLDHEILVERIILILGLSDELHTRSRNLKRKIFFKVQFLAGSQSRTAEPWVAGPSSYPLDHDVLVAGIISELPDEL